jgi:very-short-patch-repair endonuclease
MQALFELMAAQHGVASTTQVRTAGISRRVERRLLRDRVIDQPCRGVVAISHGASARLHVLDGFAEHDTVDVLGTRGANPHHRLGVTVHRTRAEIGPHLTEVGGIPTLTVAATLALLAPAAGIGPTARALDSALRDGIPAEELRTVATAWRRRGRAGPPALLMLLGERVEHRLPRSWFQRLAKGVLARAGVRLVDEYPVRDARGILLAELDLADPDRKVGVECQSWQWHATPTAQHRDARRRGALRQLGWEIVDIWWSDLHHADRVIAEVAYLLRSRTPSPPNRPADAARSGRS